MPAPRQLFSGLAIADVALFVIAAAFNNQSSTSVDGIIWWLAIALFVVIIVLAFGLVIQFIRTRAKRPRRSRTR